jgi:hypothetical protein
MLFTPLSFLRRPCSGPAGDKKAMSEVRRKQQGTLIDA